MKKVLLIGQLPKEAGGNYTTGAAKVVYELSKQKADGIELYIYATNASAESVKPYCEYPNQYMGYEKSIGPVLKDMLLNMSKTCHEWRHYVHVDHKNPFRYAFYKVNIQRAIERVQPDLIHVHSIGNVSSTKFAIGENRIPILLTCHGVFYRGDPEDKIGRDQYMGNLPFCDYYTGLTEESRHELTDILGIPPDKYTIVPNGVNSSKFFFSQEWRQKIRNEMKVDTKTFVFITVASLQERKGQAAFIKILEKLAINYQYWLIGDGPDKELIEKYVTEHNLENKVKLLGYHDSDVLYRYYSAADIYAHVSTKEGQALCEIEANATGLRTVLNSEIAGTVPDISQGDYYVFDPNNLDVVEMTQWINKGTEHRVSRTHLDWSCIIKYYQQVYEIVLHSYEKDMFDNH